MLEISDQKINVIGNNAPIETGIVRFKGTKKDGKPVRRKRALHDDLGLARRTLADRRRS